MTTIQDMRDKNDGGKSVAPMNIMQLLGQEKNKKQLASLAGTYFTADRILALCVNSIRKTPQLAACDPQSVLGAFMACAALGLEPNTPTQQAFLIPYKRRAKEGDRWVDVYDCQFQIGYKGYITLAFRSGYVKSIEAEAIHEHDVFEHMQGSGGLLRFQKKLRDRGSLVGSFCYVQLKDGSELAVTLPLEELHKIRAKSEAYRYLAASVDAATNDKDRSKALAKLAETPWVMWEDTMAAKSAIKYIVNKRLPLDARDKLAIASNLDEREIDLASLANPATAASVFEGGMDFPEPEDVTPEPEGDQQQREPAAAQQQQQAQIPPQPESQASAHLWQPTEAEKAAIAARERAEAGGQQSADAQLPQRAPRIRGGSPTGGRME